tara:strand:- start:464 stop:748 length:285 start_codon:yes stop_codon:yes gene_type:complete
MRSFRSFILAAQKRKKCPEGYRFDKKLGVCVPIGMTRYYPYFGARSSNGDKETDTSNGNGQNGNGSNGNNQSGNGQGGGNGNDNTGNGNGGNGS